MKGPLSRREFLIQSSLAVGAAAAAAALSSVFSSALSFFPPPKTLEKTPDGSGVPLKEARFWKSACAGVQCLLCPFVCFLPEGARGICNVRMNHAGKLVSLVYGQAAAVHVDPIEKKPVFHMYPGSRSFSIATVGCNLRCAFCQNWELSQTLPEQNRTPPVSPEKIVEGARLTGSESIAYTYSEPMVFYEYVYDTARLAKEKGLKNIVISAGYVNAQPLKELAPYVDVMKVDLKGFNENFYRRVVKGELRFVLNTLVRLVQLGVFTEIVNLVVPTLNDDRNDIRRMCRWVKRDLGTDIPVFFSRFTPQYRLQNLPPTPVETLHEARSIALEEGLHYVYVGNVPGDEGEHTYCPTCKKPLIERYGYAVLANRLTAGGHCPYDGTKIPGIWH